MCIAFTWVRTVTDLDWERTKSTLLHAHSSQCNILYLACWASTLNKTFNIAIYCTLILALRIMARLTSWSHLIRECKGKLCQVERGRTIFLPPSWWMVMQNSLKKNHSHGKICHLWISERTNTKGKMTEGSTGNFLNRYSFLSIYSIQTHDLIIVV